MNKRFGSKDVIYLVAFASLLVCLLLAMYMIDRQWLKMADMQRVMAEQAQDLRGMRSSITSLDERLRSGAIVAGGTTAPAEIGQGAFSRAWQATQQPDYQSGDWLVQAFGSGLKTITPLVSSDAYAREVQSYVFESLLTRDPETLEWQGLIARDWNISADGLTIRFRLREDVKFSDGKPLTAHDVAFSFAFVMNETIAAPRHRAYFEKIERVDALGDYEVEFRFREPYFNALSLAGGMEILPRHFYATYLETPEVFNQSKGLLLGSGPYRLADPRGWTPDQGMVELERNPRYWGPVQPPFNRILWKVIENDSARLTTFRNGEIDVYGARPREYQGLLDDAQLQRRARHFEYMSPVAGYMYLAWNQERAGKPTRFADARVRRAMSHLTDVDRVISEIMLGYAEPAVSPFNPRSRQHDTSLQPVPYDVAKARALLVEAGYADRGDGVLRGADGKPFEFELVFFQDNEDTRRIVLFLRDVYARAGIRMLPKPTEWAVMIDLLDRKDFDAITLGWTSGVETDIYQMFHSSQAIANGDNFISYRNPELDRLIDAARATVDEDARMPIWQEAERVMYEDQPYTFLLRRKTLAFIDRRIQNLQVTRLGLNLGLVPVEVYVPGPMQKYQR